MLKIFFFSFHSSYPHGGWAISGLVISSILALAANMYGVTSCRFFYIDYFTDRGDFSDFFQDPTADGAPVQQRVGAGLFQWLVPYDNDWKSGQCAGFSEAQRKFFSDNIFEV